MIGNDPEYYSARVLNMDRLLTTEETRERLIQFGIKFIKLTPEKWYLNGANLSGLNLCGADFTGVDLKRANFRKANLRRAYFEGSLPLRLVLSILALIR